MSSESEDEVLGVDVTSDEDGNTTDLAPSDVEEIDDDIPNVHAWGKDRKKYYQTDYVDPDYGGYVGKDAALADQEEAEAVNLQKELTQKLNDAAFTLDFLETEPEEKAAPQVSEADVDKLSKRQKIELLKKESPEFYGLIEEYKAKNEIIKKYLEPVIKMAAMNVQVNSKALSFVTTLEELMTNYSLCIMFYLLLKTAKAPVTNHPVIKRLNQFRELIALMEPIFEEVVKPEINVFLEMHDSIKEIKLKALREKMKKEEAKERGGKRKHVAFESMSDDDEDTDESNEEKVEEKDMEQDDGEEGDERRPITYQIAKNKGLTPHRKKEQRNPRVKYKHKFRKATIRRKGAVRTVRTEMSRYGGEVSGIKASVSKSIKLKS